LSIADTTTTACCDSLWHMHLPLPVLFFGWLFAYHPPLTCRSRQILAFPTCSLFFLSFRSSITGEIKPHSPPTCFRAARLVFRAGQPHLSSTLLSPSPSDDATGGGPSWFLTAAFTIATAQHPRRLPRALWLLDWTRSLRRPVRLWWPISPLRTICRECSHILTLRYASLSLASVLRRAQRYRHLWMGCLPRFGIYQRW
jgi:hypothetical protein